jgi:methylated-DNA-[protein]-cysteine S-methyltransferase
MTARSATIITAAGPFTIVANDDSVLASGWTAAVDDLVELIHPSLRPATVKRRRDLGPLTIAALAYHDGDLEAIDDVPVTQTSGPFLMHAWKVLRTLPAGQPISYARFARECGNPAAVRAVAGACARNAAALFVPCHRVLRTGGALGGFRWGLAVKTWLLDHEAPVGSMSTVSYL